MKEFIENLIGRLEETDFNDIQMVVREVLLKYGFPYESVVQDEVWDALDELSSNKFAIKIVKKLAEEYKDKDCSECSRRKFYQQGYEDAKKEYINTSTDTSSGWIPCSERLPKSNGWYLVTNVLEVVQQQYWGASHWQKLRDEAVIAWMPLPQPYTEEQKELSTTWQQQTMNRFERVE